MHLEESYELPSPCEKFGCGVLLLALIPILLAIRFRWDAIFPIIIYLQLLLIWAQAEIGLRQHVLFSAQFDPFFDVELTKKGVVDAHLPYKIYVRNTSKNPAYNIRVGRILYENKPMPPDNWNKVSSEFISSLAPDQKVLLCSLNEDIVKNDPTIEVSYSNHLGEWREICIAFFTDEKLFLIPRKVQAPGILLNTIEGLTLFLNQMYIRRYLGIGLRASKIDKGKVKKRLK